MSFITKRERVFNEYDLYDLPARNEGKLKAYASCTDARAWSHFHSDKTEHLVEIIKRNNDKCAPKYVPTTVIVDTLMVTKNVEIGRLKRKIESLEQMLAVYDDVDLDCNQKCEIAKAHEAIKAANKELDEMCLDLDLSGFTEGLGSDAYETGKSRGDETSKSRLKEIGYERRQSTPRLESKSIQLSLADTCTCEAGTNATDPRIDDMQEDIINKDAKLSAMQNTIAVMENDVCEPYCVYAHIYTALEKIFGILNQNDKYREYLDLLTAGKDTRCIDIKGKILFKMKVLEKFCLALIAPCSQEFTTSQSATDCSCYQAVVARVETAFALTTAEARQPSSVENKRAQLVAEIMDNEEMKDLLNKDCCVTDGEQTDEELAVEYYNIDSENLNRLKDLQKSYDELMVCYENLKHERDCLQVRCSKYNQLEKELENLQSQVRSYSTLWNEKEHYRKRSEDLDTLREKFVVLCDEATQLETQLKIETEKNYNKTITIDDLRREILQLEKKINEVTISFEREKNALLCKLKETECKCMCQDQQIKQLTVHLDQQLEKKQEKDIEESEITIGLINEIDSLKDQIKSLKDLLCCSEEDKLNLQEQLRDKLKLINDLKMEVEDWRSSYEKVLSRNNYLEKYVEDFNNLEEDNKALHQSAEEKDKAINNLMDVISEKSMEMNILLDEIERKRQENKDLLNELQSVRATTYSQIGELESDRQEVLRQLHLKIKEEEQKTLELINKMEDYDALRTRENEMSLALQTKTQDYDNLEKLISKLTQENKELKDKNEILENNNNLLSQEIKKLRSENDFLKHELTNAQTEASSNYNALQNKSENLTQELNNLKHAFSDLIDEKNRLEYALDNKAAQLDDAMTSIQLTRNQSEELIDQIEHSKKMRQELSEAYKKLVKDKYILKDNLSDKNKCIENLITQLNKLKEENSELGRSAKQLTALQQKIDVLKAAYNEIEHKNACLENQLQERSIQMDALIEKLHNKDDEQTELLKKLQDLSTKNSALDHNITNLKEKNTEAYHEINFLREKGTEYCNKLKYYEHLAKDLEKVKTDYEHKQFHMEEEIKGLTAEIQSMYEHNHTLKENLLMVREKLSEETKRPEYDYDYIQHEVQKLKQEKMANQNKIRELLDVQDKNENTISNLRQELLAKDDKIAVLENHINVLEDEIQLLHRNLEQGIDTGEDIIDKSIPEINATLKQIEAHHSKASHNIKVELAKLKKENALLEEKLSNNKPNNTDELLRDKHKYVLSQNIQLQNERDVIVSGIQQLEMISAGDSDLAPDHCEIDQVLTSIERVRRCFVSRNSQNSALEQTLLKIQSSSQLVLRKADEAKKIAENEKQKITNEKEDAIKERLQLEQKLTELQNQLTKQIINDEKVIKDLESEILNQKLIIDKINESTQKYIAKLQEEIDSLQDLYKNAQIKIQGLETDLQNVTDKNNKNIDIIQKINELLENKSKEVIELQAVAKTLKSQNDCLLKLQKEMKIECSNKDTQTEIELSNNVIDSKISNSTSGLKNVDKEIKNMENIGEVKIRKRSENKTFHNIMTPQNPANVNEVQILTANIEPTIDLVKNIYQNYKINKLSPGPLELNSIASNEGFEDSYENPNYDVSQTKYFIENMDSPTLIDIFSNKQTIQSLDSARTSYDKNPSLKPKLMELTVSGVQKPYQDKSIERVANDNDFQTQTSNKTELSRVVTEFQSEDDGSENESHSKKSRDFISLAPTISEETAADQEVFMIFRDSDSSKSKKTHEILEIKDANNTKTVDLSNNNKVTVKPTSSDIASKKDDRIKTMEVNSRHIKPEDNPKVKSQKNKTETKENLKTRNKKESLQINIPRVNFENQSIVSTITDGGKKSVDLFAVVINPNSISEPMTRSDIDIAVKHITDKSRTPSLPSISNLNDHSFSQESLNSTTFASEDETLQKILRRQLSDTDDEKLKQRENALNSNKSYIKTEGETSEGTAENAFANTSEESHHKLSRVPADVLLHKGPEKSSESDSRQPARKSYGLEYILDTVRRESNLQSLKPYKQNNTKNRHFNEKLESEEVHKDTHNVGSKINHVSKLSVNPMETISKSSQTNLPENYDTKTMVDKSVLVNVNSTEYYENKIESLTKTIDSIDKDYRQKLDAIKAQYDTNIKNIISEHNHGVKSMQNLHEEILEDIMRTHENEVENLRGMSMEAMRKADKLAKVNQNLLNKIGDSSEGLDKDLLHVPEKETVKITGSEENRRRARSKGTKTLSKTSVESFDVKPKARPSGPCTCTLDANISDTIRNIFDQVDVDQRRMAEFAYMKYIANKMLTGNVEILDAQELSFLHYKVCRSWKSKLSKEEALQKRIDALESELMSKQRNAQEHMAELDRKVTEERRRLQEVCEAVCSNTPAASREVSPSLPPARPNTAAEKDVGCTCKIGVGKTCSERRSAGDLTAPPCQLIRFKRPKTENHRAVLAKPSEDRRGDRRLYCDEQPTRLRKTPDRFPTRGYKK